MENESSEGCKITFTEKDDDTFRMEFRGTKEEWVELIAGLREFLKEEGQELILRRENENFEDTDNPFVLTLVEDVPEGALRPEEAFELVEEVENHSTREALALLEREKK